MWRKKNDNPVMSFVNLRRLLGVLGMALPLICYLGGLFFGRIGLQRSISYYYYSNVRDGLVGLLLAVAVFMISYRGYEFIDDLVASFIGLAALGVALFPCLFTEDPELRVGLFRLASRTSNLVHLSSAGLFFLLLGLNSIFLFTLTDKPSPGKHKLLRNAIYIGSGVVILLGILGLTALELLWGQAAVGRTKIVFIVETLMLEAFGFSWLVKGETILKDEAQAPGQSACS